MAIVGLFLFQFALETAVTVSPATEDEKKILLVENVNPLFQRYLENPETFEIASWCRENEQLGKHQKMTSRENEKSTKNDDVLTTREQSNWLG